MPDIGVILAFALVAATMACTPGPNMINFLSQTASGGAKAGYFTLAGSLTALILIAAAAVLGLTSVLMAIPSLYVAMKILGAAYLLYLAVRAMTGGLDLHALHDAPRASWWVNARSGFLTNALNPKMMLLYMALLPPFIDTNKGHIMLQTASLAGVQICVSAFINSLVIASAGSLVAGMRANPNVARSLRVVFAGALGFFAVRLALDRR